MKEPRDQLSRICFRCCHNTLESGEIEVRPSAPTPSPAAFGLPTVFKFPRNCCQVWGGIPADFGAKAWGVQDLGEEGGIMSSSPLAKGSISCIRGTNQLYFWEKFILHLKAIAPHKMSGEWGLTCKLLFCRGEFIACRGRHPPSLHS